MTEPATQDDATLAQLAKSGDLRAFDELARRYQSSLLQFVRRTLPNEAEDVVQETFVKAYQRLKQYRPAQSFKNWVFAIAYHESIDQMRRRRARPTVAMTETPTANDPADHAAAADEKASLWSIAQGVLSDEQFTAVWLFYVEDMPTRDIARVQKRSWVSVKVMLHRARATLGSHLSATSFSRVAVPAHEGDL